MLFSRLPLSLLTLIFAFAVDNVVVASPDNDGDDSGVEYVDIFAVDYPIVAYILSTHEETTTYHIACSSDTHTSSCPFAQPYTLIQGPSTLSFEFTAPVSPTTTASTPQLTQSFTLGCALEDKTSMSCSATGLAEEDASPITTSQTFSFTGTAAQAFFKDVKVVTKTEELLTYVPGTTSSSAQATITESGESGTKGGVFFEGKQVVSSTTSGAGTGAISTGILVAEASASPSVTAKSSDAGKVGVVYYSGLVISGLVGLVML